MLASLTVTITYRLRYKASSLSSNATIAAVLRFLRRNCPIFRRSNGIGYGNDVRNRILKLGDGPDALHISASESLTAGTSSYS